MPTPLNTATTLTDEQSKRIIDLINSFLRNENLDELKSERDNLPSTPQIPVQTQSKSSKPEVMLDAFSLAWDDNTHGVIVTHGQ